MSRTFLYAAGIILMTGFSACSSVTPTPGSDLPIFTTATLEGLPTNVSIATPTLTSGDSTPEVRPGFDEFGLPLDLTGHELIAAQSGESIYSGYSCTIAPEACFCEDAAIRRIEFAFPEIGRMDYHFSGDAFEATWRMTRIGSNQWSYTLPLYLEDGTELGAHLTLLTFTQEGFALTEGASYRDGQFVTCPDVYYRRLRTPIEEPTP